MTEEDKPPPSGPPYHPRSIDKPPKLGPVARVLDAPEHTTTNVAPIRRLPGQTPPEASAEAIQRLLEGMIMSSTITRHAADAYVMLFKICLISAPFGEHGAAVSKIIGAMAKKLEAHLATLPNTPPPSVA